LSEFDVWELAAREAIREVKARYCLMMDSHCYDRLRSLFTSGATVRVSNISFSLGRPEDEPMPVEAFIAGVASQSSVRGDAGLRFHIVHTPLISVDSPTSARALWPFSSSAIRGHYEEEYRLVGRQWRIHFMSIGVIIADDEARLARESSGYLAVADRLRDLAARWEA
jgi:SnoaL-like domain